jgi:hypothetical protein
MGSRPAAIANLLIAHAESDSVNTFGILWLEHINIVIGSKELCSLFYFTGLGLTRDATRGGSSTIWANLGRQQFHLGATGGTPQIIAGTIGISVPDIPALRKRLDALEVSKKLEGTQFNYQTLDDGRAVQAVCPWGNTFLIYSAVPPATELPSDVIPTAMARTHLGITSGMGVRGQPGIRFVLFNCGSAACVAAIATFYERCLKWTVCLHASLLDTGNEGAVAVVSAGAGVALIFTSFERTKAETDAMAGVHLCVYIDDFEGAYFRLKAAGLVWSNPAFDYLDVCDRYADACAGKQFRFKTLSQDDTCTFELEHETRSAHHLQFMKQLQYKPV